jgi:hypothetical protein
MDDETLSVVREHADDDLPLIDDPELINLHIFWAVGFGALPDVEWWTANLKPGRPNVIAAWSVSRLLKALPAAEQGHVEPMERAIGSLAPFVLETEKSPSALESLTEALAGLEWPDDAMGSQRRRLALYTVASSLRHLDEDGFDDAMITDLVSALDLTLDNPSAEFFLGLVCRRPPAKN